MRREVVVAETESLRELGYSDREIWKALGYKFERSWKRALQCYDKYGAHKRSLPRVNAHGSYRAVFSDKCTCRICAHSRREWYDRANARKRAARRSGDTA